MTAPRTVKKPPKEASAPRSFATIDDLDAWLREHHASTSELWVRMYKKATGKPSVDWNDCVRACLAWGWIDGQRKPFDDASFIQRLTPRRPRSAWSKRNCDIAEELVAAGKMQPPGLAQIEAARADGRWDSAYAGSRELVIPDDFLAALKKNRAAKAFFETLNRTNLFTIYHRLHTAKRPETRERRIAAMIATLASGKAFH
ncbi:MAG: YdeI/OmpD-associated family protein [Polyangiaceae bacterium]